MSAPSKELSARSLGWLTSSVIVIVFGAVALFQFVVLPERAQDSLVVALESKGASIARLVAHTIAPAIDFDDQEFVEEVFRGALEDSSITEIHLREHSAGGLSDRDPTDGASEDLPVPAVKSTECSSVDTGLLVSRSVDVAERAVATLHVHLSTEHVEEQHKHNTRIAGGIAAVLMLIGLATAGFASSFFRQKVAQVSAARDRAEAIVGAKDAFMAAMSHEVRSPLNAVLGMAQNLSDTQLTDEQRILCATIVRSGRGIVDLVNRQLDLAKLDAARLVLAPSEFGLQDFVETFVVEVSSLAGRRGVDIAVEVQPGTPGVVKADRMRLGQILSNLLNNAVKFTDAGHIMVQVSSEPLQGAQVLLKIDVSDTGSGVDPSGAEGLFEPFVQASPEIAQTVGGTGLGLSLVKQLAELMGGTVGVRSQLGHGSTFSCTAVVESVSEPVALPLERVMFISNRPWRRSAVEALLRGHGVEAIALESLNVGSANSALKLDMLLVDAELLEAAEHVSRLRVIADGARIVVFPRLDRGPNAAESEIDFERVHWPLSLARLAEETQPGLAQLTSRGQRGTQGGRVLVVDDDPINRQVATLMLESLGFSVAVAAGGCQALQLFDETFDCVLMDIQMPGMSGAEASTHIRAREREKKWGRTPIYACSAAPVEPSHLTISGFDGELPKPLLKPMLALCVNSSMGRKREQDPSTRDTATSRPETTKRPSESVALIDVELATMLSELDGENGESLLGALIGEYEQRMTSALAELGDAIESGDGSRAQAIAHTAKGTSLQLGARALAGALAVVETSLRSSGQAGSEDALKTAQALVGPTLEALRPFAGLPRPTNSSK